MVQLSDAHLGSFDGTPEPVLAALEKVNALEPDVVLFTGDLVNELAEEAEPWVEAFAKVEAPLGKFSVMGNHDYADYGPFTKRRAREHRPAQGHPVPDGLSRCLTTTTWFGKRTARSMVLLGVENWGKGFRQSGDLGRALAGSGAEEPLPC